MTTDNKSIVSDDNSKNVSEKLFYSGLCFEQGFQALFIRYQVCQSSQAKRKYILPVCFQLAHTLECYFKSYLVFCGMSIDELRTKKFGHNLENLHNESIKMHMYDIIIPNDNSISEISCKNFQEDNNFTKSSIQELVDSLHKIHCGEDDYADRYLNFNTTKGYPSFISGAEASITDLQCILRTKMPYPKIIWNDRK